MMREAAAGTNATGGVGDGKGERWCVSTSSGPNRLGCYHQPMYAGSPSGSELSAHVRPAPPSSIRRDPNSGLGGVDLISHHSPRATGDGEGRESSSDSKTLLPLLPCLSPQISDPIQMASTGRSMLLSLLLFAVTLSLLEMYRGRFASSELMTIAGGFVSALLFLLLLTFIGNYQEASGIRTGWGAVVVAELVALIVAGTVHRVCITTCFLFSAGFLYEVDKLSRMILARSESKARRY